MLLLGRLFASSARRGIVIAFRGGLGMGKTTFCKGLAEGLGIQEDVTSPTFAIVAEYRVPAGGGEAAPARFVHIDAYRLSSGAELDDIGFADYLDGSALVAIEWSENAESAIPRGSWLLEIEEYGDDGRLVRAGNAPESLAAAWAAQGGRFA